MKKEMILGNEGLKNTKERGKFTLFAYQHKPGYFVGACLEFDLIVEGKTLIEAKKNIFRASISYLLTVIKNKLSDKLLNCPPDPVYLKEYIRLLKRRAGIMEKIEKGKKQESEKLIPWDKYFAQQDIPYSPDSLKKLRREELCV